MSSVAATTRKPTSAYRPPPHRSLPPLPPRWAANDSVYRTPPLAPTKLSVTTPKSKLPGKNGVFSYTLHWAKPTAPDLSRVVVVLSLKHAPNSPSDGRAIYQIDGRTDTVVPTPDSELT